MKHLLKDFHQIRPESIEFEIQYNITGLFDSKNYLNASAVAEMAGISKGMMRQYTSGQEISYLRKSYSNSINHSAIGQRSSNDKACIAQKINH